MYLLQIWEVKFSRSGDFEKVARAFNLSGHTSGVYSFSFSADSSRVATVSKDGTWKVFNTDIEYTKGQDASVIISGSYDDLDSSKPSKVTISPDGEMEFFLPIKSFEYFFKGKMVTVFQDKTVLMFR